MLKRAKLQLGILAEWGVLYAATICDNQAFLRPVGYCGPIRTQWSTQLQWKTSAYRQKAGL